MTRDEFLNKKQPIWSELETSLKRARRHRANNLSPTQLDRLGYLYRRVTSDLAVARRDFPDDRCVPYLNALASRAHAGIYQSAPLKRNAIRHFFFAGFPTLFRSNRRFVIAAFLMFAIGFAAAYWLALENSGLAENLVPQHLVETIHDKEMWTNVPALQRNLFASFVMTNNIQVAFSAFALGVTFMIGTVYILAFNGVLIGAVAGLCHVHGLSPSTMVICFTARLYRIDDDFYRGRGRAKDGVCPNRAGLADPKTGVDRRREGCRPAHRRVRRPARHRRAY